MFNIGTSVNSSLNCLELVRYSLKLFIKNIKFLKKCYIQESQLANLEIMLNQFVQFSAKMIINPETWSYILQQRSIC